MTRWFSTLGLAAGLLVAACGDDTDPGTFADASPPPDASQIPDAAPPVIDANIPPDAPMSPLGPIITVLNPQESTTLDSDSILTSGRFTGRCRAETNPATGASVDQFSVRMTALVGSATQEATAAPTSTVGEFVATFDLSEFPNGAITVRCTASDTAVPSNTNSASIGNFLDLGPIVTMFSPAPESAHAGTVPVEFRVDESPVIAGDTEAAVGTVRAFIGATEITLSESGGAYMATVPFDDASFPVPLDGPQSLSIQASNMRSPDPVTRFESVQWLADNDGPVISINSPSPGDLVSGLMAVSVSVSDPAGVDGDSVSVTVAHEFEVDMIDVGGGNFAGVFDTRLLDLNTWVFPPIEARAADAVGNSSSVGHLVGLDNRPPIIDLDPPLVREARIDTTTGELLCSTLFDPLGEDSTDDGEAVLQLSEMRVRINDFGNGALSLTGVELPIADTDTNSVQLFVLDSETVPLIVDTDLDGICDDINPAVVPMTVPMTAMEAAVIDLVAIGPSGTSHFNPPAVAYGATPTVPDAACTAPDPSAFPPALCATVDGSRVIDDPRLVSANPIVYGIPPTSEIACLGNAFDSQATNIADGWACVAVKAADNLGNVGVSRPIRVCFDHDGVGGECHAVGTIDFTGAPSCTDGCALPLGHADVPPLNLIRIDL